MKTKNLIIVGTILTIGTAALYYWANKKTPEKQQKIKKNTKEPNLIQNPPEEPETPEMLLKRLIEKALKEESLWRNEREFLTFLTKSYIAEVPDVFWINYLPLNQEDLLECLLTFGYLESYEAKLEAKYRK